MSRNPGNPVSEPGQDRRSLRTQQALSDALIALLADKHYDAITVQDIVDRANVGRSTFYVYYPTKDDLLRSGFVRVLDALLAQIVFSDGDQAFRLDTTALFRHACGHYEIYRTLMWGSGYALFARDGHAALSAKLEEQLARFAPEGREPPVPLPVLAYSMAGTLLLLLQWWLDHKMPYPPERMDAIFQQLVV